MISMRELERFLNKSRVKKYVDESVKSMRNGLKRLEEQSYVKVKVKKEFKSKKSALNDFI